MRRLIKALSKDNQRLLVPPGLALRQVTSRSGKGVYASSDKLYKGAVFGRDSLEVGEDLLMVRPRLVKRIILTLARLQGESYTSVNDEEPGKIIHEYRSLHVDGKDIDGVPQEIFRELAGRWGGSAEEVRYYGSVDATPLFVRLVGRYCDRYGEAILDMPVVSFSGHSHDLRQVFRQAVDWTVSNLEQSKSGLLEFRRHSPSGILNQAWKDSQEFYVHKNGELANHDLPIASIEVQGLVYDALQHADRILAKSSGQYRSSAESLRDRTIQLLWLEKENYFALGTDYTSKGRLRVIKTLTANPAALLDTRFFDELPPSDRQRYLTGIISVICSPDFLTDGGVRSRSLSDAGLIDYWDYHGSYVTWPKETHDIAKGLRRQGFIRLAKQLENRLLNMIRRNRSYPEFAYVDRHGRVMTGNPSSHEAGNAVLTIIDSTNHPEKYQAWTVSAVLQTISTRLAERRKRSLVKQEPWQAELEERLLADIPKISRLLVPGALAARYPTYPYKVVKKRSSGSSDMPGR